MSWLETMFFLIPWWCTRKDDGHGHASQCEPAKGFGKNGGRRRSGEDEDEEGAHSRCAKVADAVRKPSQQVQDGVSVCREDVGEVGAVKDVLERGKDFDPDVRAVLYRDEAINIRVRVSHVY